MLGPNEVVIQARRFRARKLESYQRVRRKGTQRRQRRDTAETQEQKSLHLRHEASLCPAELRELRLQLRRGAHSIDCSLKGRLGSHSSADLLLQVIPQMTFEFLEGIALLQSG